MKLEIKALSPLLGKTVPYPKAATEGSAGIDLCACIEAPLVIPAHGRLAVPCGIAIALPSKDYVALLCARSGLAIKKGIALANGVGVIDSDYRGELLAGLINNTDEDYTVLPGDRICQLMVLPVALPELEFVTELGETERGEGGLGSTGR